jgi:hypothetical protein
MYTAGHDEIICFLHSNQGCTAVAPALRDKRIFPWKDFVCTRLVAFCNCIPTLAFLSRSLCLALNSSGNKFPMARETIQLPCECVCAQNRMQLLRIVQLTAYFQLSAARVKEIPQRSRKRAALFSLDVAITIKNFY